MVDSGGGAASWVGVTALLSLDGDGKCNDAALTLLSVGEGPLLAEGGINLLRGQTISAELIDAVAEQVATRDIEPTGDIHASVDFRRHLAKVLTKRALLEAKQRCVVRSA